MSQARIYSALALKNIQASLMFLARLCYIFGGSEIYRLPYIHLCKIIVPLWIKVRTAYKWVINVRPFCMLSVYLYLHFRQSLISVAVCILSTDIERGKVFGVNTLRRRKIQSETACRPTFQLSRADVLPLQTSKGKGRMTESGNS